MLAFEILAKKIPNFVEEVTVKAPLQTHITGNEP